MNALSVVSHPHFIFCIIISVAVAQINWLWFKISYYIFEK